jgi:hypothetical protein
MSKDYICILLMCLTSLNISAQNYIFTWEGSNSGIKAVWAVNDASNVYYIPELNMNVKVSIIDPYGQNTTEANMSDFGDYTRTNTFFGSGNLALQATSANSGQSVCLKFEFEKPVYLRDFKIYDIDMKQDGSWAPNTFQDSIMVTANRNGVNTPLFINHMSSSPSYTIYGQTVRANYIPGMDGDVDYNDLNGAISVSSSSPLTEFALYYSNGSQDDGISNSHAIKIPGFDIELFQSPLPVKVTDLYVTKSKNEQYTLSWIANSEINNDLYTISLSSDGTNFIKHGVLKSYNLSNHQYFYHFWTNDIPHLYVKLEQTDFDGTTQILGIVDIQNKADAKMIKLRSTIVSDILHLNVSDSTDDFLRWEIYDMQGRFVTVGTMTRGEKTIDTYTLKPGTYTLKVSTTYLTEAHKFIKL